MAASSLRLLAGAQGAARLALLGTMRAPQLQLRSSAWDGVRIAAARRPQALALQRAAATASAEAAEAAPAATATAEQQVRGGPKGHHAC